MSNFDLIEDAKEALHFGSYEELRQHAKNCGIQVYGWVGKDFIEQHPQFAINRTDNLRAAQDELCGT